MLTAQRFWGLSSASVDASHQENFYASLKLVMYNRMGEICWKMEIFKKFRPFPGLSSGNTCARVFINEWQRLTSHMGR